jgi:lipopolysaccharide transport system ATP-binding protein
MGLRLGFAVAAHLEPEILIVDEVLAVGDAAFQKKCLGKLGEVAGEGRTVLFVSHNMMAINALCKRAFWIDDGRLRLTDATSDVVDKYLASTVGVPKYQLTFEDNPQLRIQFLSAELEINQSSEGNEQAELICTYQVRQKLEDVLLAVEVQTALDVCVFYTNDTLLHSTMKRQIGCHTISVAIPIYLLAAGDYRIRFGFWQPGHSPEHFPEEFLSFHRSQIMTSLSAHGLNWPGLLNLPVTWKHLSSEVAKQKVGI